MADASFGEQRQTDFDSGAGTDLVEISGIVVPASGGAVVVGGILETGVSAFGALGVGGGTPHDSVDSGNPIKIGGVAYTGDPTPVANGDRVAASFDTKGRIGAYLVGFGQSTPVNVAAAADGSSFTAALSGLSQGLVFNGSQWDRARSIEALDAAPNVKTGIPAVGIGPGFDIKTNPAGVVATSTSNAVTVVTDGANTIAFHVTTIGTTPGSMIIETTSDDTNWATAGMVYKLSSGPDTRVEGSFVPAVNDIYLVRVTGVRQVRYRVNATYASGTATVKVTASAAAAMVKGTDLAPAPHNIGYALVGVSAQYTSAQTSTTIGPTVSSTQRMVVTYVQIQAGGTVAATQCSVYFGTGAYTRGTSKTVFDGEFAPSATLKPGAIMSPPVPFMGAADEELKITSVGAANPLTITIWYYLIAA